MSSLVLFCSSHNDVKLTNSLHGAALNRKYNKDISSIYTIVCNPLRAEPDQAKTSISSASSRLGREWQLAKQAINLNMSLDPVLGADCDSIANTSGHVYSFLPLPHAPLAACRWCMLKSIRVRGNLPKVAQLRAPRLDSKRASASLLIPASASAAASASAFVSASFSVPAQLEFQL